MNIPVFLAEISISNMNGQKRTNAYKCEQNIFVGVNFFPWADCVCLYSCLYPYYRHVCTLLGRKKYSVQSSGVQCTLNFVQCTVSLSTVFLTLPTTSSTLPIEIVGVKILSMFFFWLIMVDYGRFCTTDHISIYSIN